MEEVRLEREREMNTQAIEDKEQEVQQQLAKAVALEEVRNAHTHKHSRAHTQMRTRQLSTPGAPGSKCLE